ncbi:MAG: PHP domain-containing protein [Armatimonadota bacterium]
MDELPRPIPPHDAHVHTVRSDGADTVAAMVRAAEAVGLDSIAITDHVDAATTDLQERVAEIRRIAARSTVAVIPGAELRILDARGQLALPPRGLDQVRLVLAGLTAQTTGIAEGVPADRGRLVDSIFAAYAAVVESEHVDVIANPLNLGRFPAPLTPEELPRAYIRDLARLMADREVALELAATAWWWHPELALGEFVRQWVALLRVFAHEGVKFVAGSNAHCPAAVGNNHFTRRIMRLSGIELSQVVNLRGLAARERRRR